ncbi:MAG: hypothetical protein Q9227_000059 [Pyrenula ochraceoflavens]
MSDESTPHVVKLPSYAFNKHVAQSQEQDLEDYVRTFLISFKSILSSNVTEQSLGKLFVDDCWFRDLLTFTWDLRTIRGTKKLLAYLQTNGPTAVIQQLSIKRSGPLVPRIKEAASGLECLESLFDFETKTGYGSGVVRLVQDPQDEQSLKCWSIFFTLQGLKGYDETVCGNRPSGTTYGPQSLQLSKNKQNWLDARNLQQDFNQTSPVVLVIGAGHSGLNTAARLQQLGISTLVIDKHSRVGDNWRTRYKSLVTHDPVNFTHLAYLPFPQTWPLFTPKDKLGDWFEHYASILELNVWTSTTLTSASYSSKTKTWTVKLNRNHTTHRILHPKHVILCTGHSGEPSIPNFPGQSSFTGTLYHGSAHVDASTIPDLSFKRVLVVGTGNSGHDIAQNFHEHGAKEVTMLQRHGTYVINATKGNLMQHAELYGEDCPPTEDADLMNQSLPLPVVFAKNVTFTKVLRTDVEKELNVGLEKAGFAIDEGPARSGLARKYMTKGGGYYLDVGCSQLIIDGKVKVRRCEEGISHLVPDGLVLKDGQEVKADVIVLATGYDNMRTSVKKILGDKVASYCKDVWDLDGEGEINAMWRYSGHEGFWYMGGNLALVRIYSKVLALQIKALEIGLFEQPPLPEGYEKEVEGNGTL